MTAKEEFSIISRDGTELIGYEYLVPKPKALVCLIHGLGEHSGRYEHVAQFFCEHEISFFIIDLRGHGQSEGKKGHASNYDALLTDIEELMMYARAEYNDLPMFLYGHSLGGNLVTNFCLLKSTSELSGAILSSPWFTLKNEPPHWKITLAKCVSKIWPGFTQANEINAEHLTHDLELNAKYLTDESVHDKISVKLFSDCHDHGKWALAHTERLKIPLLALHGEQDEITSKEGTLEFASQRPELITYESLAECKHEPHNDLKKEEVLKRILKWVKERI